MTKIAVSSEGPGLEDRLDPRFGRAAGFVLVDTDTGSREYLDNGSAQVLAQGAGIQAAESMARAGVSTLLTGYVGPKAFQALQAAGIQVIQDLAGLTVGEAVERFRKGGLMPAEASNRDPGAGAGRGRGAGAPRGR
jgi:predicted Fe-Mo cluster-binding NifX family protein